MIFNYIKIAFRNLLRFKVFSMINILGLALGITCFIVLSLFIIDEQGYDDFNKNADCIFRIYVSSKLGGQESNNSKSPAPLGSILVKEFPEVINYTRIGYFGQHSIRYQNNEFREGSIYTVDSTFFDVFTLPLIYGDKKNVLVKPNSVVLTAQTAKRYFGNINPVGKLLVVDGKNNYLVTGVMKDFPRKAHFQCDFLLSSSTYTITTDQNWLDLWYTTYVTLKPGTDSELFEKKIQNIIMKYVGPQAEKILGVPLKDFLATGNNRYEYKIQPLKSIYLYSGQKYGIDRNTEWGDMRISNIVYSYVFAAIALFILLIAVFNFMNLATARSESRSKEVGIRKTLGSNQGRLISQFITESVITAFFSVLLSQLMVQLILPVFNNFVQRELTLNYFDNLYSIPVLVMFTVLVGVIAGSYPSLYLSSFQPAHILKRNLNSKKGKSSVRNFLVVIQFAISITLIIGTVLIKQQLDYIRNKNLGFNKEQLITIDRASALGNKLELYKNEILKNPHIISATASSLMFQSGIPGNGYLYNKTTGNDPVAMQFLDVDEDFIDTYKVELKEGRYFSDEFISDSTAVVLNESAVKSFNAKNPVGKIISRIVPGEGIKTFNIIGVVKDFNYESLHNSVRPLVFHYGPVRQASTILAIRFRGNNPENIVNTLRSEWGNLVTNEKFYYRFMDENIARMYMTEQKIGDITSIFSFFAIFIACMGLFGLAAFVTEKRTKEIGIRKVLGSSVLSLVVLLSKDFLKWIIIANILAYPVAFFVMRDWLNNFAYRIEIDLSVFVFASAIAIIIALVTVGVQTVKAAAANPVKSLKYE